MHRKSELDLAVLKVCVKKIQFKVLETLKMNGKSEKEKFFSFVEKSSTPSINLKCFTFL